MNKQVAALHETLKKVARCTHEFKKMVEGREELHKCQSIAVKNYNYCCHHIKLYPDIYKSFIESQSILVTKNNSAVVAKPSKYNFHRQDFSQSYADYYKHESLIDLKNEIALLSATLNKLYSMNLNSVDNLKVLDMQIKIINQIRLLIKTMRELDEGKKTTISFNDLKIFMLNVGQVIKNYVADSTVQKKIAQEVFELYQSNESKELDLVEEAKA